MASSAGRECDSCSQDHEAEPHTGWRDYIKKKTILKIRNESNCNYFLLREKHPF